MPANAPSDFLSLQASANLVLPGETVDEAVRRYILTVCSQALRSHAGYFDWLDEATKRYEALRSTRSLDQDDPGRPWSGSSNVGLPLEAITGEALIPRFNAATVDAEPIHQVSFEGQRDPDLIQHEEQLTNFYQDLATYRMRVREVRDETWRNMVIDGDAFEEPVWLDQWAQRAKTLAVLQNARGEFLTDEATGAPRTFDANLQSGALPEDPLLGDGKKLKKILVQRKDMAHLYEGPGLKTWRIRECIWPEDATTADVNELDWFCVQMWKSPSWFKTREGDPLKGGLKNVEELLLRVRHGIPGLGDTPGERLLTEGLKFPSTKRKALVWRFFGQFDVDGDGIDEEIIALVAPRERLLLGWRLSGFRERPFFHFQLFTMPGRFNARGLPSIGKGIRDIVDFHINMANNRANLYLSPPLLYEADSGFDPDLHQYGSGVRWGPLTSGGVNKIKALELPKSQDQLAIEFINFYMSILQRLTGITDFNLGGPQETAVPNVKTATGTVQVIQEGNIKFADFIRRFQRIGEREWGFIDREFLAELADSENLALMSQVPIDPQLVKRPKRFRATGNSATMSRQAMQQVALFAYTQFAGDPVFQLDPATQRQLRQWVLDQFDIKIELPKAEELGQMRDQQMVRMFQQLPDEEKLNLANSMAERLKAGQTNRGLAAGGGANGGPPAGHRTA